MQRENAACAGPRNNRRKKMEKNCICFATGNEGKLREIREILKGLPFEVKSMKELGIDADVE